MAKQSKQTELDIIPVLEDVVSLGKIPKSKKSKSKSDIASDENHISESEPDPNKARPDAEIESSLPSNAVLAITSLNQDQEQAIKTRVDELLSQKLNTLKTELSKEISTNIINYLNSDKSSQ